MSTQALQILPEPRAVQPPLVTVLPPPMPSPLPTTAPPVRLPDAVVDFDHSEVRHHNGERDVLSTREVELLRFLAANAGRPVSRDEILQQVWRLDPRRLVTRTIDMHIANLREKLRDNPSCPKVIFTVRGCGYRFVQANSR